jgi:hypothetical protein
VLFTLASLTLVVSGRAEEIVAFGERYALYNGPAKRASFGLILLPGGEGDIGISQSGEIVRQAIGSCARAPLTQSRA